MPHEMPRRDFLKTAPAAVGLFAHAARGRSPAAPSADMRLQPFDYVGVRLLDSRWLHQSEAGRNYYFGLTNDDILHGFRVEAGLPAPGDHPVRGWGIEPTTGAIFGQWLSGMARMSLATGDDALRGKAVALMNGWGETLPKGSARKMSAYEYDKFMCGLVDMYVYAGEKDALPLMARLTEKASSSISRDRVPASRHSFSGRPGEWYTLSENLYRAFQATGDERYRTFAEVWLGTPYWSKFADTASPPDAHGVHAYSHVNTFSSAAMHYEITGDPRTLRILENAYDYLQNTQCFATGGYGPDERILAPDGSLGRALEMRPNTFETVCGSWAGFKMARYLMRFTGKARYGDWIERLFYNGVGSALPIEEDGRNFYYSDYRSTGGMKVYRYDNYTCCSGTYFQCMADYSNLVYYKDDAGLYVNLYVPSEVVWEHGGGRITLRQETDYPVDDETTLTVRAGGPIAFPLSLRVPEWCSGMKIVVNGAVADVPCKPGTWATVSRTWKAGDRVKVHLPQPFRWEAVDHQHPKRAAIVRGSVVMPLEFRYLETTFKAPRNDQELNEALTPDTSGKVIKALGSYGAYRLRGTNGRDLAARVRPFYEYYENYPYLMYIDRDEWPVDLWA